MIPGTEKEGRVAVVTGGSMGIGKATGVALAQRGYRVVLIARGAADLTRAVNEITSRGYFCSGYCCDLSIAEETRRTFDQIQAENGAVNILVNSAGVGSFGPFGEHTDEQLSESMQVPTISAMRCTHCVLPAMSQSGHGCVINVLTPAAYFPLPYMAPYTASRWALLGFSRSLHNEMKKRGIHIGTVCPGLVDTDYLAHNNADFNWWPKISKIFPVFSPEQVASQVVRSIDRRQREFITPGLLRAFIRIYQHFPNFVVLFLELSGLFQPSVQSRMLSEQKMTNWETSIDLMPAVVVHPESVRDIIRVVQQPHRYPTPVRTCGSRHSTTHCGVTDNGTLLSTLEMNRIIDIDAINHTVTVQAGALYIDVAKVLERHQLQFFVNVEMGNLTMGSAACTGTKDASFPGEMGQVCSYLVGVKMILANGSNKSVDETEPELLQAVRSSYGLLGVIHEVTFKVRPLVAMEVRHETFTLDEFEIRLPELLRQKESMMYYLFPFSNRLTVEFRRYHTDHQPFGRYAWSIRNLAWKTIAPACSALLTRWVRNKACRFFLIDGFYRLLQLILTLGIRSRTSFAGDQIIRYPESGGLSQYTFSIWAFPEETIVETMRAYYWFCQHYYLLYGYRCDIVNVGYRIEQDQKPLFSYSWNGNVMTLDPVCTGREEGWDEFLHAYNRFCSDHNGVPLFNQSKWLTREQVDRAFGQRIDTFNRLRQQMDPNDRFLNSYFKSLFGSPLATGPTVRPFKMPKN